MNYKLYQEIAQGILIFLLPIIVPNSCQSIPKFFDSKNFEVDLMGLPWDPHRPQGLIYITISTFTSVRPYGVVRRRPRPGVPLPNFQFLQAYEKVSLIKVAWYVLRVKNIHSWSPSDLWSSWGQDSMLLYIIRQKAKLNIHTWKLTLFHIFHSVGPKQLCVQLVLPSYYHNLDI